MRKTLIIVSMLSWIGLIGCDDNEEPTTFQGKVVFPEGYEEASRAKVGVLGLKSRGVGTPVDNVMDSSLVLDEENRFRITFPAIDVQYYKVGIDIYNTNGVLDEVLLDGNGIDCAPHDCNSLEPGKSYDLTIRVVE